MSLSHESGVDDAFASGSLSSVPAPSAPSSFLIDEGKTGESAPLLSKVDGEEPEENAARSGIVVSMCAAPLQIGTGAALGRSLEGDSGVERGARVGEAAERPKKGESEERKKRGFARLSLTMGVAAWKEQRWADAAMRCG